VRVGEESFKNVCMALWLTGTGHCSVLWGERGGGGSYRKDEVMCLCVCVCEGGVGGGGVWGG
jgi:hypothetical protein